MFSTSALPILIIVNGTPDAPRYWLIHYGTKRRAALTKRDVWQMQFTGIENSPVMKTHTGKYLRGE